MGKINRMYFDNTNIDNTNIDNTDIDNTDIDKSFLYRAYLFNGLAFALLFFCTALFSVDVLANAEDGKGEIFVDSRSLPDYAYIKTNKGDFVIQFYKNEAPLTVRNFVKLIGKHFYDKLKFHRQVPGFIVQGGDPLGTGAGGPGWSIPAEFSDIKHRRGTVGMARYHSAVNVERRSNGSQFYITLDDSAHLDGLYTVFAHVIQGIDVVDKLREGDSITTIKLARPNAPDSSKPESKSRNRLEQ